MAILSDETLFSDVLMAIVSLYIASYSTNISNSKYFRSTYTVSISNQKPYKV